ncbi:hypothetical protein [Streptomyces aureocirculatus]|uniref:hypothetical protein n=1 Tax=Streptomyces aureocirculatus TaxID=67275 RepID=UPI0004CBDCD9|nr:hypothetical protein [Streptomyces aureocirculatus]
MQRRVYVPGAAALLMVLLAGCTGNSGTTGGDDGKPGESGSSTVVAEPGKYRTLPEPCGAVDQSSLDSLLPGITDIEDSVQREKAYEGAATVTYDNDRRVGCRWKVEAPDATHHLLIDFERVVSYDGTVSDDTRAEDNYRAKLTEAGIPEPSDAESPEGGDENGGSDEPGATDGAGGTDASDASDGPTAGEDGKSGATARPDGSRGSRSSHKAEDPAARPTGQADDGAGDDPGPDAADDPAATRSTPDGYEPRTLDDLGDEAFVNDALATAASATRHRTVTVVFRTSNVIVTVEYDEQPARRTEVPDSKEMQDNARELAGKLADRFDG